MSEGIVQLSEVRIIYAASVRSYLGPDTNPQDLRIVPVAAFVTHPPNSEDFRAGIVSDFIRQESERRVSEDRSNTYKVDSIFADIPANVAKFRMDGTDFYYESFVLRPLNGETFVL